jgi:hypothetical protein
MAYDEGVAERIREMLGGHASGSEMRSFGGLSFLLNGNMSCGVLDDELVVRVGSDAYLTRMPLLNSTPGLWTSPADP